MELAKDWASIDPNPKTKALTSALTEEQADAAFNKGRIAFGTAGLRSKMSAGPLNMNDVTVYQTAQGIARYLNELKSSAQTATTDLKVVVGYDHRCNDELDLSSEKFAKITKAVFDYVDIPCILLSPIVATPLVPFATTRLGCSVGIMVTASHNPKEDDGYKLYWSNGCQIIPPHDANISAHILANLEPWKLYDKNCLDRILPSQDLTLSITEEYFGAITENLKTNAISNLNLVLSEYKIPPPKFAYTAMHGVGGYFARRSFQQFDLVGVEEVESQFSPDPTFPTVKFPNPEEKGALDLAKTFSDSVGVDLIFANDPDADRLAVAEKNRVTGKWTTFHGNQIGVMLGMWLWETRNKSQEEGKSTPTPTPTPTQETSTQFAMVASAVSSKMLSAIADREGFRFEETLTGFKWIGSKMRELQAANYKVLFGYEEAIGFCCGDVITDKDGISAMGVFAELAHTVYASGKQLTDHMQSLYDKYGEFVTNNGYFFCYDSEKIKVIFDRINNNGNYVESVGGYKVKSVRDLLAPGYDSTTADNKPLLPTSTSSPMLTITFENGCCAQFRASGTEPKFKYYIELQGKPGQSRDEVSKNLDKMVPILLEELLKPAESGLVVP